MKTYTIYLLVMAILHVRVLSNDSPEDVLPEELPGPVYELDNAGLFAVAEAENSGGVESGAWKVASGEEGGLDGYWSNDGIKYIGSGFVQYKGPARQGPNYLEDDPPYTKQGPKEEWLAFKFYVPAGKEGTYQFAYRYAHRLHDGDNDCFAAPVAKTGEKIKRSGFGAQNNFKFSPGFLNGKNKFLEAEAGINAFYIAGRSINFAVDRLVVWKVDGGDVAKAKNLTTPESKIWQGGNVSTGSGADPFSFRKPTILVGTIGKRVVFNNLIPEDYIRILNVGGTLVSEHLNTEKNSYALQSEQGLYIYTIYRGLKRFNGKYLVR